MFTEVKSHVRKRPVPTEAVESARRFLRMVEKHYKLPYKIFYERHPASNRPLRAFGGKNLTDIKTAALRVLIERFPILTDSDLAKCFEMDRTSCLHLRVNAENLLFTNDERFMAHYHEVRDL